MKRIILAMTIAAFAVAVQAGEGCTKDKAACATKDKVACAAKADSGCCPKATATAKANCSSKSSVAKGTCPKAQAAKKRSLMSPKAAGEVALN